MVPGANPALARGVGVDHARASRHDCGRGGHGDGAGGQAVHIGIYTRRPGRCQ